jgi:ABC-type dipeptide/oligopeptide/nickel transport system permease component
VRVKRLAGKGEVCLANGFVHGWVGVNQRGNILWVSLPVDNQLSLSYLLGGVIIVEVIFNYPGVAKLMVDAVAQRDLPLVQACAMLFCAAYLMLVTTADICAILSNPRLRHP